MSASVQTESCPSCAAPIPIDERWTQLAVCGTCRSAVSFGGAAAKVSGTLSVLPPSRSRLFSGALGKIRGRDFQVLGRLRYGWERGFWDEWHLLWLDDGSTGWLSEDEDRLVVESLEPHAATMVTADAAPGSAASLNGRTFNVVERGVAAVEGGEGQLPFVMTQDERTLFVELRSQDGSEIATVEFAAEGRRVFLGVALSDDELHLDFDRQDLGLTDELPLAAKADGSVPRLQSVSGGVRPLKCHACAGGLEVVAGEGGAVPSAVKCAYCGAANSLDGASIACPNCQTPVQTVAGDARLAKCPSCTHQIDLARRGGPVTLGRSGTARSSLAPGDRWEHGGIGYRVTGRLRYDGYSEGEPWSYWEYCLFADSVGYRWLVESEGKWSLCERIFDHPALAREATPRSVSYQGKSYSVAEVNTVKVGFVEGELPWVARRGDVVKVLDTAPLSGRSLSVEWGADEVEWYLVRHLKRAEVVAGAPGLQAKRVASPSTAGSKTHGRWLRQVLVMMLLTIAGGFGIHYYFAEAARGDTLADVSFGDAMYTSGGETHEIEVEQPRRMSVRLDTKARSYGQGKDSLAGGWVHYTVTMTREQGDAGPTFTSTHADFYHGGTKPHERRLFSTFLVELERGRYKVHVAAVGGNVDGARKVTPSPPMRLAVKTGVRLMTDSLSLFLVLLVVSFIILAFWGRQKAHSVRAAAPKWPITTFVVTAVMWGGLGFAAADYRVMEGNDYKPVVQAPPSLATVSNYLANRAASLAVRSSYSSSSTGYSSSSSSSSSGYTRRYSGGGYRSGK